jgi:hypothetical protein
VSIFAAYVAEFGIKRTRSCEDLEPRSGEAYLLEGGVQARMAKGSRIFPAPCYLP